MYECPNCGGNLKFDIVSQQMACAFCGTHLDPYTVKKDTDAVEEQCFEATVFTCPQCGGELFSSDSDATSFCSFCGAATILSSRIANEKRPDFIIPFKKTKEDCKNAYRQAIRKNFFVTKEMRDPKFIDGFRGIYMPYWSYQLTQRGEIKLAGEKSKRKGDYIYTDHYDLTGDMDAYYLGYSFDASSSFYDNISETLAPYDAKELTQFTPAFLSGFYADTADVAPELYLQDAKELAEESSFDEICKEKEFKGYSVSDSKNKSKLSNQPGTKLRKADHVMYPVWFMSWRKGERVAYVAVNGQTGKVAADIPMDPMRFIIFAMILAIPIFVMLNLFFTIKPTLLLGISALLLLISTLIYNFQLRAIHRRDKNLDDRGILWKNKMPEEGTGGKGKFALRGKKKGKLFEKLPLAVIIGGGVGCVMAVTPITIIVSLATSFTRMIGRMVIWGVAAAVIIGCCIFGIKERQNHKDVRFPVCYIVTMAAIIAAAFIGILKPVSDLYYYAGVFVISITVLLNLMDVLHNYNKLAMRRLPQFDKKGGDDRA